MDTQKLVTDFEKRYTKNIINASESINSFCNPDKNILFSYTVHNLNSLEHIEDNFYVNSKSKSLIYKMSNVNDMFTFLEALGVMKDKNKEEIYHYLRKELSDLDSPFFLQLYPFQGLSIKETF